ncbi:hypothetical protein VCRA2128O99_90120 [Vibrio crassostreae]|nr:hypothetical protein VCRA2128O104_100122 [Vibrio crassostreae]CAK3190542.1 hypothetical protein VCRA2128O103_110043 [Vibrio crassostreae]CAK4029229.1 hypothetical protein VCRA2128O99_90120 [Vibrio crassostreae]
MEPTKEFSKWDADNWVVLINRGGCYNSNIPIFLLLASFRD